MPEPILKVESFRVVGAAFRVYNDKGHSFTEPIYQECLEIELMHCGIPFLSQPPLTLTYRGHTLRHTFQPDFICFEQIVVEIKAVSQLTDAHRAQVINYVNAGKFTLGLLINFGAYGGVQFERFLPNQKHPDSETGEIIL